LIHIWTKVPVSKPIGTARQAIYSKEPAVYNILGCSNDRSALTVEDKCCKGIKIL